MRSPSHSTPRSMRLLAGLVLAGFGAASVGTILPFGLALIALGLGVAGYQGVQMIRERRDRYDLESLREWDERLKYPDEPEEDELERDLIYCHRCGASMSPQYSICPACGCLLS